MHGRRRKRCSNIPAPPSSLPVSPSDNMGSGNNSSMFSNMAGCMWAAPIYSYCQQFQLHAATILVGAVAHVLALSMYADAQEHY